MEILTNGSLSKTTFQCNLGYTLKGTSQAICIDDGLWNELPPICGMLVVLLSFYFSCLKTGSALLKDNISFNEHHGKKI